MAAETNSSAAPEENQSVHALTHKRIPGWVNWVQDNLLMSCLIIAEAYLLGTLMVTGWVPNLETPGSWGIYSTIGVVVFFLAGATCAGVALRASFKAALCFERGQVKMGLINLVGCLVLCTCEFWANLTERATHLLPGLADIAVLHALGFGTSRISPTLIIVAVLLPVTTLFVGYTHFNESLPSRAERAARHQAKLDEIRQKAEERVARVQGYRGAANAAFQRLPADVGAATPASTAVSTPERKTVSELGTVATPVGGTEPGVGATATPATTTEPIPSVKPAGSASRRRNTAAPGNAFAGSAEYRKQMVAAVKTLQSQLREVTPASVASNMGRSEEEVTPYLDEYLNAEREVANHH